MNEYRYQLERYRGPRTRHRCPQCGRRGTFSRYIDTYNNNIYISDNNIYISDNVGICNRIDKCGYHYTPKQYYTDNPWKREREIVNMIGKFTNSHSHSTPPPKPIDYIPEWVWEYSRSHGTTSDHMA